MKNKTLNEFIGEDRKPKHKSITRESSALRIDIEDAETFYKKLNSPVPNRVLEFINKVKEGAADIEIDSNSKILVFNEFGNKKWAKVNNKEDLKKAILESEAAQDRALSLKESSLQKMMKKLSSAREDIFGGFGFSDDTSADSGLSTGGPGLGRDEYTPLFSGYFYKQMYLYDYQLMNSQAFWFKNFSPLAKCTIQMTTNFVIGEGYSVSIKNPKAKKAWEAYEERSGIKQKLKVWCDELSTFGDLFIKRVPTPKGINHISIEPSTVWEIVTDPENIQDVKFYWQMYNTQYQLIGDKKTPVSKYVMNHIPPEQIIHQKINCTSFEKRGRSDLLSGIYYLKMFDKYIQAKLGRAISEMSYYWDVTIEGDAGDVDSYISTNSSISDVPPGSENVHNKALTRVPLAPSLSPASNDETAKYISSMYCVSVNIPYSWLATADSGGETKASAVVKTEPVIRKMTSRRKHIEEILNIIFEDVMIENGLDPKSEREFNFPDMVVDDRSKKIADLIVVQQQGYLSKKSAGNIISQQLDITSYDYDIELTQIKKDSQNEFLDFMQQKASDSISGTGNVLLPKNPALTQDKDAGDNKQTDRKAARDDNNRNS
ncbi:MAG: hypothetical protein IPQ08_06160 [Chitinophagaceae bacterium]|nr:hypothetical protein [Chitinophagaceae bacterium]